MEVVSIDISGKFAHFRKYYANNTALSYTIPPRTTIMGMLAAMLGRERDSYYEELASDKIRIGIQILTPLKKAFHRLNLLMIKGSEDDFRGARGRIQTPFEVVSGFDVTKDWVVYRIFVSPVDVDSETFETLKDVIINRKQTYNLTLGTANFTASILETQLYEGVESITTESWVAVHSAVVSETVNELNFNTATAEIANSLEEDLLPADFLENGNREVSKMTRVLYSTRNFPFEAKLSVPYYKLSSGDTHQNILFLE